MKTSFKFYNTQRIKRKKEFKYLYEKSFRIYGGSFIYRFVFSENTRLGMSVSKKFGNAVYRNRIKRIIREEFRHKEFPYSIDLLISQSKPIKKSIKYELNLVFKILSDYYLMQQCSVQSISLSTFQFSRSLSLISKILFNLVLYYKQHISNSLTPACRFTPSCSVYALEALRVYPFFHALGLIIKRIVRCNPCCKGGYDPLPKKIKNKK